MDIDYKQLAQNWEDTALFHHRNEMFYKELIRKTGENFGVEAHISEDGSIQQDVLALKVPELVEELINKLPLVITALEASQQCVDMVCENQWLEYEAIIDNALEALQPYKNIQKCIESCEKSCECNSLG